LGIYEGGGSMEFYYGDVAKTLVGGANPDVAISLSNVAASQGLVEGMLHGRFLTAPNAGPTGRYQYRFTPSAGKPSMVIHHGEVFGGWTHVFNLSTPLLTFTKLDGTPIFENVFNSNPALHDPSKPKRTMSIRVPQGYAERGGGGSSTYELRTGRRHIVGYFGPHAGDRAVCYQNTAGHSTTSKVNYYFMGQSNAVPVLWNGSGTGSASNEAYIEKVSSTQVGGASGAIGGVGTSSLANCDDDIEDGGGLGRAASEFED
ncbi:MAG: hypothetical protein V4760_18240, partial [Bdellovibrionota bacterium]